MPKLIYFASRGRAEVIRLVCAEAGISYEEENFKLPDFAALKASGRLPFLAVPVWEEDGWRLAQSAAIANYLGRAHGMLGKTAREEAQVDEAVSTAEDVRNELRKIQSADPAKRSDVRAELKANVLPRWFGLIEKHLTSDFVAGKSISVADLALWYVIEIVRDNDFGSALGDCPKLSAFFERIGSRPKIAEYLRSPKRWPLTKLPV